MNDNGLVVFVEDCVCLLMTEDKGNRELICDSQSLDSRAPSSLSVLRRWRFIVAICLTWVHLYSRLYWHSIFMNANPVGDSDLVWRNATCARERVHGHSTIKTPVGINTVNNMKIIQHLNMNLYDTSL